MKQQLYRIFYYDCEPIRGTIYHPYLKRNVHLENNDTYTWMLEFLKELKTKRKLAIRLGKLSRGNSSYNFKKESIKKLFNGKLILEDVTEKDFEISLIQKGVDMRIGVDIASMTFKKQVDQMVLIAGDSDFVPAAKLARREGIDFILDPMKQSITDDLFEHIDGLGLNLPRRAK